MDGIQESRALLGLGTKKDMNVEKLRQALGKITIVAKCTSYTSLSTNVAEKVRVLGHFNPELLGRAATEGLLLANYDFIKYLAKDRREKANPWSPFPCSGLILQLPSRPG